MHGGAVSKPQVGGPSEAGSACPGLGARHAAEPAPVAGHGDPGNEHTVEARGQVLLLGNCPVLQAAALRSQQTPKKRRADGYEGNPALRATPPVPRRWQCYHSGRAGLSCGSSICASQQPWGRGSVHTVPCHMQDTRTWRQSHSWQAAEPGQEPSERCRVSAPRAGPSQRSTTCFCKDSFIETQLTHSFMWHLWLLSCGRDCVNQRSRTIYYLARGRDRLQSPPSGRAARPKG